MKFWALFKKEWRESLPWILGAMLVVGILGFGFVRIAASNMGARVFSQYENSGHIIYTRYRYPFSELSAILWCSSLLLGLSLGGRHFWEPGLSKTWAFQIHRSITRSQILGAKLSCAILGIPICLGAVWIGVYTYSHAIQQEMIRPPYIRICIEGCIYISFGLVVYLATALAGLVSTRWYTTRFFSLAWAFFLFLCVVQSPLGLALVWLGLGLMILMVLLWDQFVQREFV